MVHNISVCCPLVLFGCFRVLYSLYMMKGSLQAHAVAGNITRLYFIFVKNRKSCNNLYRLEHEKQFPAATERGLHHTQCLFKVY